jgi:hypothetical protein
MARIIYLNHLDFIRNIRVDYDVRREVYQEYKNKFHLREKLLWYFIYNNPKVHDTLVTVKRVIKERKYA